MLKGKKILVTAGPTFEPIDPVRFIGNRSTGKMGYAIANELAKQGAEVMLVSGPVQLSMNNSRVLTFKVETADEMFQQAVRLFASCDGAILSAAVSDFTPKTFSASKIKKKEGQEEFEIKLKRTKDILAHLGTIKRKNQVLSGFSLETDNEMENAKKKLLKKNLDFIVMNSLRDEGAGFNVDTNKVSILDRNQKMIDFSLKSKVEVARDIVAHFISKFKD